MCLEGKTMSQITQQWLLELGGVQGLATAGGEYWDFPIVSRHSKRNETYLRVHEPFSDDGWVTDLFDQNDQSIGIVNWPTTRQQLLKLMDALGCATNHSVRQGVRESRMCPSSMLDSSVGIC